MVSETIRRAVPADAEISFWTAPDGWRIRRFDWRDRTAPRGSILLLGGRGDVFEKYLDSFAHWRGQGWSVSALDWRGHGGSGRATDSDLVGHVDSFAQLVDDLAGFWVDWGAPGPRIVIGHSMGGHLLLRALTERRIEPDAAVLLSPMIRIRSPLGAWLSLKLARYMCRRGNPARAAWRPKPSAGAETDAKAMLTSDYGRLLDEEWWQERLPGTRMGPPSWGWLAEAFASSEALHRHPGLARLATPVHILAADGDRLTDSRATVRMARQLPNAHLHRFRSSGHELLREVDLIRDVAMRSIGHFLESLAPAKP
jgi:lysophospholipase